MKLVRVPELGARVILREDAAKSILKVKSEVPSLKIVRSLLHPTELSHALRMGKERTCSFHGYSGHLFGLAIDIVPKDYEGSTSIEESLQVHGWRNTVEDLPGHYSFLGDYAEGFVVTARRTRWKRDGLSEELRILEHYGPVFLEFAHVPALKKLGFLPSYEVDPAIVREALVRFQSAWEIEETGDADMRTKALLFVLTT